MNIFIVLSGQYQYIHRHVLKLKRWTTPEDRLGTFIHSFFYRVIPFRNSLQF